MFWNDDCDVGDEGVATLGCYIQLQSSKISKLKLDMNSIGDIGMVALSQGLKCNQSLQELDLYCNDFGELGVKTLMSAISSSTNSNYSKLHTLSLRANRISNNGATIIAKKLNHFSKKCFHFSRNVDLHFWHSSILPKLKFCDLGDRYD